MSLVDKIRKARETGVEVSGFRFTIRRPTDQEAVNLKSATFIEIAQRFVIGWAGVKELDLIPGGEGVEVQFDEELWKEWCADRPEFWQPITTAVLDAYQQHRASQDETKKKP
jgi:hypothetical protein